MNGEYFASSVSSSIPSIEISLWKSTYRSVLLMDPIGLRSAELQSYLVRSRAQHYQHTSVQDVKASRLLTSSKAFINVARSKNQ